MSKCVVHSSRNSVRYWPFVRRIYETPMVSSQRPVTGGFDAFFDVGLKKPLNSRRWFETLWRWCDVTAMNLRVINKAGFDILNSLIFFAFFTNSLFGSFWLFTSIPKAVLAITSIEKFPQMLKRNKWCHDEYNIAHATCIHCMMTSSNGNNFRVTGPLCGEFTGDRWIPLTNGQWSGALMLSLICARLCSWTLDISCITRSSDATVFTVYQWCLIFYGEEY